MTFVRDWKCISDQGMVPRMLVAVQSSVRQGRPAKNASYEVHMSSTALFVQLSRLGKTRNLLGCLHERLEGLFHILSHVVTRVTTRSLHSIVVSSGIIVNG